MRPMDDNSGYSLRRLLVALGQKRTARRMYFVYAVLIGLLILAQPLHVRIPEPILALFILLAALTGLVSYAGFAVELIRASREHPWPRFQLSGIIFLAGGLLSGFGMFVGSLLVAAPVLRNPVTIAVTLAFFVVGLGLAALVMVPLLAAIIALLLVWVPILSFRTYTRKRARRRYHNPVSRVSRTH